MGDSFEFAFRLGGDQFLRWLAIRGKRAQDLSEFELRREHSKFKESERLNNRVRGRLRRITGR